jgi:hypothetical protein
VADRLEGKEPAGVARENPSASLIGGALLLSSWYTGSVATQTENGILQHGTHECVRAGFRHVVTRFGGDTLTTPDELDGIVVRNRHWRSVSSVRIHVSSSSWAAPAGSGHHTMSVGLPPACPRVSTPIATAVHSVATGLWVARVTPERVFLDLGVRTRLANHDERTEGQQHADSDHRPAQDACGPCGSHAPVRSRRRATRRLRPGIVNRGGAPRVRTTRLPRADLRRRQQRHQLPSVSFRPVGHNDTGGGASFSARLLEMVLLLMTQCTRPATMCAPETRAEV